ncbi:MAG: FxsA family protein [Candidatus Komeilibacteria bacterium]|nr:FxsA family protein [Candidatus Komeilibacteria bacterium]
MLKKIIFLIVILPVLELLLLWQIGAVVGAWDALGWILVSALLGMAVVRHQGILVWSNTTDRLRRGEWPEDVLVNSFLIMLGGVLLIFPGIITDLVGILLFVPIVRQRVKKYSSHYYGQRPRRKGEVIEIKEIEKN